MLSTLWADDTDPNWAACVEVIDWRDHRGLISWLRAFVPASRGRHAVILRGTVTLQERYRDLVGAVALKLVRGRPPLVVVSDATIEPGSRALARRLGPLAPLLPALSRLLIRAADGPHVRWCVLSSEEVEVFARTWGVPSDRVVFTPFTHTLPTGLDPRSPGPATDGDEPFFFAGGTSLRDYDLLAAAADGTGLRVVVASSWRPRRPVAEVSAGYVSHDEFLRLMRTCRANVVPISAASRSAGQQTYLNSMALAKPTIVTAAMGVLDHVEDGVTGIVVEPDVAALRSALVAAADPANADDLRAMGARAQDDVLTRFTPPAYRLALLRVAGVEPPDGLDG